MFGNSVQTSMALRQSHSIAACFPVIYKQIRNLNRIRGKFNVTMLSKYPFFICMISHSCPSESKSDSMENNWTAVAWQGSQNIHKANWNVPSSEAKLFSDYLNVIFDIGINGEVVRTRECSLRIFIYHVLIVCFDMIQKVSNLIDLQQTRPSGHNEMRKIIHTVAVN